MRPSRRLPGIVFETQSPPPADTLPRMDVAAFAGFASSGPLHCPVAVQNVSQFAEIFGDDAPLAFDTVRNEMVNANLGPAVRSFFRNGGVRCWIERIADASQAETSRFPIAGLYSWSGGTLSLAIARARSAGSWADSLEAAAKLNGIAIGVTAFQADPLLLTLAAEHPDSIGVGDLLRVHFRDDGFLLMCRVAAVAVQPAPTGTRSGVLLQVSGADPLWAPMASADSPAAWTAGVPRALSAALPEAELVTFDLVVRDADLPITRAHDLGFTSEHPVFWANLPDDATLYMGDVRISGAILAIAANPRFVLAGEEHPAACYVPIGMPYLVKSYTRGRASGKPALVRDGLANFNSGMFLDRDLIDPDVNDLLAEADFIRYQSPDPRRHLVGIHALLSLDEITLAVVPDASHRGWDPSAAPLIVPPQPPPLLPHPEWWHFKPCDGSPVPLAPEPEWGEFLKCGLLVLAPPTLKATDVGPDGEYVLQWSAAAGTQYLVEEALEADWSDAAVLYKGPHTRFSVSARQAGVYYYRVRVTQGCVTSDWSGGIKVVVQRQGLFLLRDETNYDPRPLLDIQRALVRIAGARADLLAVLSLPEHYREPDTLTHAARLKSASDVASLVRPLSGLETKALSYAALYHPWLIVEGTADPISMPPDGAVIGVCAGRALTRGAWIAPANQPLDSIVALSSPISESRWLDMLEAHVNVMRQDPHGFLCLSADTLSGDDDLRPINVRRLLILLRRLALRESATYVFEPNSPAFARLVKYSFESLLTGMYDRGAFAGDTADQSFQVITDDTVNTPQTRDNGQFFVDLRVAPSLPMQFMTVRLVQSGGQAEVTEVA
jgi:hypothetical protein